MTYSIAQSRQALEHALSAYEQGDPSGTVVAAARAGILTLGWLERHQDLMREINRLNIERPELAELLKTFPGAKITDVRQAGGD